MRTLINRAVHDMVRKEAGGGGNAGTGTRDESVRLVKQVADIDTAIKTMQSGLSEFMTKANGEMAEAGKISKETAAAINVHLTKLNEAFSRLDAIEAKYNRTGEGQPEAKSIGQIFIESESYATGVITKKNGRARQEFKGLVKGMDVKAIVNATGQNQPLVPDMRVQGIIAPQLRRLTIRDLLPVGRTQSNLVQYVTETLFTNNAGPQVGASPTVAAENVTKPESDLTFALNQAAVATLAHFILASKQVLEDAPMLQSYIDSRLLYGLKLEEEDQILNGDGAFGNLSGLFLNAVLYNRQAGHGTDTKIDILRRLQTQVALQEMDTDFYALNPVDWEEIELTKDSTGRYILARPESLAPPTLWGKPVIATQSVTVNNYLGGNATLAAQIWDREDASVEVSREDGDNFKKNMVTILAEERLALTIYRPAALVKGTFP